MKTFKDFDAFKRRNANAIAWDDYFKMGGRVYTLYEYGGGSLFKMDYDYVYFLNRKTRDAIYVKYHCPSVQYVDGKPVQTREYELLDMELQENITLWR